MHEQLVCLGDFKLDIVIHPIHFTRGRMRQKIIMIPVLLVLLAGLMHQALSSELDEAPNTAKVRVYQIADITLYPGEYCYGSNNPAVIHASASGFSIFGTRKRVGMPVTEDSAGAYNEYVIQASLPVTVMLHWEAEKDGVKASCGPIGATFYPQVSRNYDVTVDGSGNCFVQIRELYESSPGKVETRPVPADYSYACASK